MIEITKLNGQSFLVNENLIETVESNPDTVIIMANGRKFVVQESINEVMRKCNERLAALNGSELVSMSDMAVKSKIDAAVPRI
jgi:flagellar protein FlbD